MQEPPPGMVQMPQVAIEGPLPGLYADLHSIRDDLAYVRSVVELAQSVAPQDDTERDESDKVLRRALWGVRYDFLSALIRKRPKPSRQATSEQADDHRVT